MMLLPLAKIRLHNDLAWYWVLLFAIACLGIAIYYYLGAVRRLPRRNAVILVSLRAAAILLVLLFLFRPAISYTGRSKRNYRVAVLVDASKSMEVADSIGGRKRLDAARNLLFNGELLEELEDRFSVTPVIFGGKTDLTDKANLRKVKAEETATDIAGAFSSIGQRMDKSLLQAVVLISDGRVTAEGDVLGAARALGVPVFTVGIGSAKGAAGRPKDLAITNLVAGDNAFAGLDEEVTVTVERRGFDESEASGAVVKLSDESGELSRQEVVFRSDETQKEVKLSFTPPAPGFEHYEVEIVPLEGEKITQNNFRDFGLTVRKSRIKVLYIEAKPRPEAKFLRFFLERNPIVKPVYLVLTGKDKAKIQGDVKDLDIGKGRGLSVKDILSFDVVILGDVPSSFFTLDQLDAFKELVDKKGKGLAMIGGYDNYGAGGYVGTPVGEILPVVFSGGTDKGIEQDFFVEITAAGKGHPIFRRIAPFFARSVGGPRSIPPLKGAVRVDAARPGARILAECPLASEMTRDGKRRVVLAVMPYGAGRTLAFTGDTTWVWYRKLRPLGKDSPYEAFWGQMIIWLAGHSDEDSGGTGIDVWTERRTYSTGEAVKVFARLPQEITDAACAVTLPDGRTEKVALTAPRIQDGPFEGTYRPHAAGPHSITMEGSIGDVKPYRFMAGRKYQEFENIDLNADLLSRIADVTRGQSYTITNAKRLPEQVEIALGADAEEREIRLYNTPLFFILFLWIITIEWVFRKRNMLL
ncbi:MAG: hypothetical protein E3J72_01785 [Planctomycetota bacterium]|nr:MAG: hypothetical protein E3J72_01785 [Planctomycetota bacterium]